MKVLHLITGLDRGGAERQLTALVRGSDPAMLRHVVVSLADEGVYGAELRAAGAELYCLGLARGQVRPAALLRLIGLIRRHRPDVLQTWLYHADMAGLLAWPFAGRPALVWTIRCSNMRLDHYAPLTKWVLGLLARFSFVPRAVVANSAAGMESHRELGYRPRRALVIPNGIDTEAFRPDPASRHRLREEWGLSEETVAIGMVARFDPMKDHANLLTAAAGLAASHPQAVFILAGKGTDAGNPQLARLAEAVPPAQIRLLGERGDVTAILAALDYGVLSSRFGEGFPNAVAESMACGLPCLVTDVGDAREIVGDTGWVVHAGDPHVLRASLARMVELPADERVVRGRQARRRIEERYGLPVAVAHYQALYRDILAEPASRAPLPQTR